jgi:hypothetical protein
VPRKLTQRERFDQAFRVAVEVLQLEADSEPADPKHECEMIVGPDVWRRMVALARQAASGDRGRSCPGICRRCGCTWLAACEKRCSWADKSMTLCSNCAGARR